MPFVDPYIDQDTGLIINLLDARTPAEFATLEAQIVFANELELEASSIPRTNNLEELLAIHKQLFKGIYDWAGEFRTVDIRKDDEDSEFFLLVGLLDRAVNYVFTELAKEDYLRSLAREEFVRRLAYYYDQLNYIHPFREGNGRTQRVFWGRVAADAGYNIDWSQIRDGENDGACKAAAEQSDLSKLVEMFDRIVS